LKKKFPQVGKMLTLTRASLYALLATAATTCRASTCGSVIKSISFPPGADVPYVEDDVQRDWAKTTFVDGYWGDQGTDGDNNERATVGDGALNLLMPAGCIKKACAMQVKSILPEASDSATLSYRVKFSDDFDWVKGGKMPGLCGAKCQTGCKEVSGLDGWSSRMMWRPCAWPPNQGGAEPCSGGKLAAYVYNMDKTHHCGDDIDLALDGQLFVPTPGEWIDVVSHIAMNTAPPPGGSPAFVRDGVLRMWANGVLVIDRTDMAWRQFDDVGIDTLYLSVFYGGGSPSFAPPKDNTISFADFEVRHGECSPEQAGPEDTCGDGTCAADADYQPKARQPASRKMGTPPTAAPTVPPAAAPVATGERARREGRKPRKPRKPRSS
jgi:hypothetical protein